MTDVEARTNHPAPYPKYVLERVALYLSAERRRVGRPLRILDPMAGVGRIHDLPKRLGETVGVELEPEWAACRKGTQQGDATNLPADWTATFDAVVVSPVYGNRMSDHHEAKDGCYECGGTGVRPTKEGCGDAPFLCPECHSVACTCGGFGVAMRAHNRSCRTCKQLLCKACKGNGLSRRYTYRHALGRPLSDRNAGQMQWPSEAYRLLHEDAWAEAHRVLTPGGLMLVNVKNHIRGGTEQYVAEFHEMTLRHIGFEVAAVDVLPATKGMADGANGSVRVTSECIVVARTKDNQGGNQ